MPPLTTVGVVEPPADLIALVEGPALVKPTLNLTPDPVPLRLRPRYRAIAATGRDLTRKDMIDVLTDAGYSPISAAGRMSSSHPLFTRTGPDRYRLVGQPR